MNKTKTAIMNVIPNTTKCHNDMNSVHTLTSPAIELIRVYTQAAPDTEEHPRVQQSKSADDTAEAGRAVCPRCEKRAGSGAGCPSSRCRFS